MIKYIGSKRLLVPYIVRWIEWLPGVRSVADLFSGTARVGHALKKRGLYVVANDHNRYAHRLAQCYVQADARRWRQPALELLDELSRLPGKRGYFTETFCERSRYLHPKNGARVDAIREAIARKRLDPELEAILLVALMEAADRVDSTCGVQMAFLKKWAPRAHNDLELRLPELVEGEGEARCTDAAEAAAAVECDLAYLDPPYNQHRYLGNYHVWETLIRWDKPDVYGVACKRVDCRDYRSEFNSRQRITEALQRVIRSCGARFLLVSFNNEGFIDQEAMLELLQAEGQVQVATVDYKRYVGAQIGIYNPQGERVGKVGRLRNQELLFLVSREGRLPEPPAFPAMRS